MRRRSALPVQRRYGASVGCRRAAQAARFQLHLRASRHASLRDEGRRLRLERRLSEGLDLRRGRRLRRWLCSSGRRWRARCVVHECLRCGTDREHPPMHATFLQRDPARWHGQGLRRGQRGPQRRRPRRGSGPSRRSKHAVERQRRLWLPSRWQQNSRDELRRALSRCPHADAAKARRPFQGALTRSLHLAHGGLGHSACTSDGSNCVKRRTPMDSRTTGQFSLRAGRYFCVHCRKSVVDVGPGEHMPCCRRCSAQTVWLRSPEMCEALV